MVGTFEREEKEPLKFKVEDKIMGYHTTGYGALMLVAGEIVGAEQSTDYLHDNEYEVKLIPELLDDSMKEGVTYHLPEKEARPFDGVRVLRAIEHWKNEMRLKADASGEHIKMLKLLYPENYKDEKKEKET